MREIEAPSDKLLDKLSAENPQWTVNDWERWWCRWWQKRDPNWLTLPVCAQCNCWRAKRA